MKKIFSAVLQLPMILVRVLRELSGTHRPKESSTERDAEEERLDRIRNPHKYRPTNDQ